MSYLSEELSKSPPFLLRLLMLKVINLFGSISSYVFRFSANLFCPLVINPLQQNSDNITNIMAESEADFYQPNLKVNGELILFLTMKERQLTGKFVCWYEQYISFPSLKEGMK